MCYFCFSLSDSGFPVHLLPEVVEVPALAGLLQEEWHGIPPGTAVGVAMGDMQCSIYAAGPLYSDASEVVGHCIHLLLLCL